MKIEKFDAYKTEYLYNAKTNKFKKVNGTTFVLNNKRYFYDKEKQTLKEIRTSKKEKEFLKKSDDLAKEFYSTYYGSL